MDVQRFLFIFNWSQINLLSYSVFFINYFRYSTYRYGLKLEFNIDVVFIKILVNIILLKLQNVRKT